MYKISEFSKLCHLPVKTLRYYDSEGLLIPDRIDKFTGYRYYSAAQIADCNRIAALKELGFSLSEIKQHLKAGSPEDVLALIDTKRAEMERALSHMESQLKQLVYIRNIMKEGEGVMFDLVIRNSDMIHVAYRRDFFSEKEDAYHVACSIKSELPGSVSGQRVVIINYETEYCEHDFDLAACAEIAGKLPKESAYSERTLSFLDETASVVCNKNELDAAYRFMMRQMEELSCQITGAFYEIYYEDGTVELKVPICRLSKEATIVNDDVPLVFENDIQVIGKWKFIDKVPSAEQFCMEKRKYSDSKNIWLKELYFLPDGQGYWVMKGWTKGYLTISSGYPKYTCRNAYSIRQQNGKTLMFIEMKDDSYSISRGGKPEIYVFEKVSDKEYTKEEIRIRDNTDMPFVPDEAVMGAWTVRDFVKTPDCFLADRQNFPRDGMFFESVLFKDNGRAVVQYRGRPTLESHWTAGYLLDRENAIAEAYVIQRIGGAEYLFVEWKSGDYQFGGRTPLWYVFERKA